MSRIGSSHITVPDGVTLFVQDGMISAKGKNGELQMALPGQVSLEIGEGQAIVKPVTIARKAVPFGVLCARW